MFYRVYLYFACILCIFPISISACHWFKDVLVMAKDVDKQEFNVTVNACIERSIFDGKTVKELYIRGQKIGELGRDSIKHLVKLESLSFWGSGVDSISPGALRNLPRLKNFQISYGNLKEFPRNVFEAVPSMQLLRIHNNKIDIVEDQAFANLYSLKKIYASNNNLEYWNREWFTNSTNLEIMDFQMNQIRTIPRRAFASLTKLKQIFFDNNEISNIHSGAFTGITNLEYLGLRYNRLTEIREDIFPNDLKIRSFLIDSNYLNFMPDNVLRKVSVKDITLDNNPWKCPCLDRIQFWLFRTNGTMRVSKACTGNNVPVCSYPTTFSQTCLEHVDSELTNRYIKSLRAVEPPLSPDCARLD